MLVKNDIKLRLNFLKISQLLFYKQIPMCIGTQGLHYM